LDTPWIPKDCQENSGNDAMPHHIQAAAGLLFTVYNAATTMPPGLPGDFLEKWDA
jgi:hypothetical protein